MGGIAGLQDEYTFVRGVIRKKLRKMGIVDIDEGNLAELMRMQRAGAANLSRSHGYERDKFRVALGPRIIAASPRRVVQRHST